MNRSYAEQHARLVSASTSAGHCGLIACSKVPNTGVGVETCITGILAIGAVRAIHVGHVSSRTPPPPLSVLCVNE